MYRVYKKNVPASIKSGPLVQKKGVLELLSFVFYQDPVGYAPLERNMN